MTGNRPDPTGGYSLIDPPGRGFPSPVLTEPTVTEVNQRSGDRRDGDLQPADPTPV